MLALMTDANVASEFKAVWDQFKATRDRETIPAIYTGNIEYVRKIAGGVQSERLSKMWSIMSLR